MATIFKKKDLLYFVSQAVFESDWNIIYINNEYPFKVKIFNDTESYFVKIIIYNITHGGGNMRSANEYRIQIKEPVIENEVGYKTLILGYYEALQVFAGWDVAKHLGFPGYSASFQIRAENLEQASINGFSPCDKGNGEIAIAFRPDLFVNYVQNLEQLHSFGTSKEDFKLLEEISDKPLEINTEIVQQVSKQRQTAVIQLSKKLRDSSFKARVLSAYGNKCAFSGMQLRLVDAAHIIPVSYESSTDETSNGIALSALHHRAYDKGLVTFNQQYQIVVNNTEMTKLQEIGFDGGMSKFIKDLRPIINVPPSVSDRPNSNFIIEANKLRGWKF